MMIGRGGTVTSDNYIVLLLGTGLAILGACTTLSGKGHNKELLVTSNQKFAGSAMFLGLLLLANACPSLAQAIPTLRSVDAIETNASSSTASSAIIAATDPGSAADTETAAATPNAVGAAAGSAAASTAPEGDWHFAVSPYLWLPGVHGSVGDPNGGQIPFSASAGDLLSHFRIGLMGVIEPRYKRIVMPLDIFWIRLGDDRALPNSPNQGVANLHMTEFFLTQKLGYRVIDNERVKIDALAGFRYWHFGESASFTDNTLNFTGSQNWVDPLVGGRITGILTPKVELTVGGDVGGWGAGAQIDYQFFGALGYRIKPALVLQAGYRYLYFDYRKSSGFFVDNTTDGAFFGVTITLK
jgi:hypothetical protein